LRERKGDIHLLFRKFASDFASKYKMPTIRLTEEAVFLLEKYPWGGNIRQLRNVAEQISVLEQERSISALGLQNYLPNASTNLPAVIDSKSSDSDFKNEREILYKVLFDMKSDLSDLKKLTLELMKNNDSKKVKEDNEHLINKIYGSDTDENAFIAPTDYNETTKALQEPNYLQIEASKQITKEVDKYHFAEEVQEEETLSLQDKELELIKKSLERHQGKRKLAAEELGISERTLYRKIKQYDL